MCLRKNMGCTSTVAWVVPPLDIPALPSPHSISDHVVYQTSLWRVNVFVFFLHPSLFSLLCYATLCHTTLSAMAGDLFNGMVLIIYQVLPLQLCHLFICLKWPHSQLCSLLFVVLDHLGTFLAAVICPFQLFYELRVPLKYISCPT